MNSFFVKQNNHFDLVYGNEKIALYVASFKEQPEGKTVNDIIHEAYKINPYVKQYLRSV